MIVRNEESHVKTFLNPLFLRCFSVYAHVKRERKGIPRDAPLSRYLDSRKHDLLLSSCPSCLVVSISIHFHSIQSKSALNTGHCCSAVSLHLSGIHTWRVHSLIPERWVWSSLRLHLHTVVTRLILMWFWNPGCFNLQDRVIIMIWNCSSKGFKQTVLKLKISYVITIIIFYLS